MSVIPPKAEVATHGADVRYVPLAVIRDAGGGAVHSINSGTGGWWGDLVSTVHIKVQVVNDDDCQTPRLLRCGCSGTE